MKTAAEIQLETEKARLKELDDYASGLEDICGVYTHALTEIAMNGYGRAKEIAQEALDAVCADAVK